MDQKKPVITAILSGHTSPETAHLVNDYPYGFRLRCKIRYWLEHHPKKGSRFCSQTTNPKCAGEPWNKPKASTYAYLAGCMYLNEEGHVTWAALDEYTTAQESIDWYETYKTGLTPEVAARVEKWIRAKLNYEEKLNTGQIKITVTSEPISPHPDRKHFGPERYAQGNIKEGETFSISSHMGGSFTVEFMGWDDDNKGLWQVTNEGWQGSVYSFTAEEAAQRLFIYTEPA